MKHVKSSILAVIVALMSLILAVFLVGPGCGSRVDNGEQQGSTTGAQMMAQGLPGAPAKALFGQYFKDRNNRTWIYDGAKWVPHDASVDNPEWQPQPTALKTSFSPPPCSPTGAHGGHAAFSCQTCHLVGGVVCFDPNGKAVKAGQPAPTYDPVLKTCSNIACHSVPAGTFSYYFPDGNGDAQLITVNVYGNAGGTTPAWNSTGISCTACHNDPPRNGTDGSNAWHSGYHGNQTPTGPYNQCQLCHPDASSPGNGIGDTITNPTLHANGVYNVQANFVSACFGCH